MIFAVKNENIYLICVHRHNKQTYDLDKINNYIVCPGIESTALECNVNTTIRSRFQIHSIVADS